MVVLSVERTVCVCVCVREGTVCHHSSSPPSAGGDDGDDEGNNDNEGDIYVWLCRVKTEDLIIYMRW